MNRKVIYLVGEIQKGDQEAFEELYELCYDDVYRMAFKFCRNEADAHDVAQDTFLELSKSIYDLKEIEVFYIWLYRIVKSKCIKLFRREKYFTMDNEQLKNIPNLMEKEKSFLPELNASELMEQQLMHDFVEKLPNHYKEAIDLMYFHQCSLAEISEYLHVPLGTVKSRIHMGRRKLRKSIQDYEKLEGRKIDFYDLGSTSILSIISLKAICSQFKKNLGATSLQSAALNSVLIVSSVVSVGLIGEAGVSIINEKEASLGVNNVKVSLPQQYQVSQPKQGYFHTTYLEKEITTPKDAYFTIIDVVKDADTIDTMELSSINALLPLYKALKEENGIYWNLLQTQGWTKGLNLNN